MENGENWEKLTARTATWTEDGVIDAVIELQFYYLNGERWVKQRETSGFPLQEGEEPVVSEKEIRIYVYPDLKAANLQESNTLIK